MSVTIEQQASWDRALEMMRQSLTPIRYDQWFKPLSLHSVTPKSLIIKVDDPMSSFVITHIKQFYISQLHAICCTTFGIAAPDEFDLELYPADKLPTQQPASSKSTLNPKYTFENFVVGPSNNFAYAASLAVAEQPSDVYNPLFIYGGVGLGKTHLMNAIGNYILEENPTANVLCISSETFTNELIDTIIKKKGTSDLRNRMRNVDVLMVDDIQFLSKTVATQEEFFHTFNDLHGKGKQIIISSDRPPKDIPTIEERLRSRFEWGLIVDIQRPDFETRVAILRKKADEENIDVPYEVIEFIAQRVQSNIRELEGALNRVNAQSMLMNVPITLELANSSLSQLFNVRDVRKITPESIMSVVCAQYDVTQEDIISKKRNKEIALPRQIAMYLCREMTSLSTINIGRAFGGRDHTTVMHGCDKIEKSVKSDVAFRRRMDEIMELIRGA